MYSKVLFFNKKIIFVVFFVLFIATLKPAHSANVAWTNFSTTSGENVSVYSNPVAKQIQVDIVITSTGSYPYITLDYGTQFQNVGTSGGTFTIIASTVTLEITGAATGKFQVTEIGSAGDAVGKNMGTMEFALVYFFAPLLITVLSMFVVYVSWRRQP